jgi:hypothetical protein
LDYFSNIEKKSIEVKCLALTVMKLILQKIAFFVAQKKRPTEALFWAYKKRSFCKIVKWMARIAPEKNFN